MNWRESLVLTSEINKNIYFKRICQDVNYFENVFIQSGTVDIVNRNIDDNIMMSIFDHVMDVIYDKTFGEISYDS